MVTFDAMNAHFEYMDLIRHWSPVSERFAGGDALMTFLNDGWKISENIFFQEYWHSGTRPVVIYHMSLVSGGETMHIPVLTNPYVRRLIGNLPVQLRPYEANGISQEN